MEMDSNNDKQINFIKKEVMKIRDDIKDFSKQSDGNKEITSTIKTMQSDIGNMKNSMEEIKAVLLDGSPIAQNRL